MKASLALLLGLLVVGSIGCVNARAPDIYLNGGDRPPPGDVDSSRTPDPATLDEARFELREAYRQIRYLEDQNRRCKDQLRDARDDLDECEHDREALEDRYDD